MVVLVQMPATNVEEVLLLIRALSVWLGQDKAHARMEYLGGERGARSWSMWGTKAEEIYRST